MNENKQQLNNTMTVSHRNNEDEKFDAYIEKICLDPF